MLEFDNNFNASVLRFRIQEVLLDTAKASTPTYSPSYSVERCECPKEYTGLSCQDPNVGYFRYFPNDSQDNWIDAVVGKAEPCECNGKSQSCDPNTGICKVSIPRYELPVINHIFCS